MLPLILSPIHRKFLMTLCSCVAASFHLRISLVFIKDV